MKNKVLFTWSGGKDSAMALHALRKQGYEIIALLTIITEKNKRICHHYVRKLLLEKQAQSLGLPLETIQCNSNNEKYQRMLHQILIRYRNNGIQCVGFGDISLENLRKSREEKLAAIGMKSLFPLWLKNTRQLAHDFMHKGFRAIITSIDTNYLSAKYVGRNFNEKFLLEMPKTADPCGENGEFHSFVYDGPIFNKKIIYQKGRIIKKDNFYYCDLLPAPSRSRPTN